MAIYKKGSDPVALRASAERLTAHARSCEAVKADAARAMHSLKGHWTGGDLQHLMGQWPPIEAQIGRFGDDLAKLAEALRRNAGQQDSTSGQGGSVPGFPGGGPGGGNGSGSGNNGIPGYDTTTAWMMPLKILTGLTGAAGFGMKAYNFTKNLGNWSSELGVFKNLGAAWKTGPLAGFADALNPKDWGKLPQYVGWLDEGSKVAKTLGTVGKVLGAVGVAFGGFTVANDIAEGNYGRAAYDGVMTGLTAAALMTPPPANAICGAIAGGMAVGQLVYDNWDSITEWTGNAVDAVGDFASDAADAVGDVASDIGEGIADVADKVWPW